jgi:hypothetical protein
MNTKSLLLGFGLCLALTASSEPQKVARPPASTAAVAPAHLSKPGAPVRVSFVARERPEAGQPLSVDIRITPRVNSESLRYTIRAPEGLMTLRSVNTTRLSKVRAGSEFRDTLTVIPQQNGRYLLSVVVVMDSANGPLARAFSWPIVVGNPVESGAGKRAPAVDWSGQKIESMPAQRVP